MAGDQITVSFNCRCGGKLETKDDVQTDASIVTCKTCGVAIGTYGEVIAEARQKAIEKGRELVHAEFIKAFGSLNPTITIKL